MGTMKRKKWRRRRKREGRGRARKTTEGKPDSFAGNTQLSPPAVCQWWSPSSRLLPAKTPGLTSPHISRPSGAFCSRPVCPLLLIQPHTSLFSHRVSNPGSGPSGLYLLSPTAVAPISPIHSYSSSSTLKDQPGILSSLLPSKWNSVPPYTQRR